MTGPEVLDVARDGILTLLWVAGPMMLVGLAIGVAISLLQALTQIQEQTLVFVPKIIAMFVVMLIVLPFMGDVMSGHMTRVADPHHLRALTEPSGWGRLATAKEASVRRHDVQCLVPAGRGNGVPPDVRQAGHAGDADARVRRAQHSRPACG